MIGGPPAACVLTVLHVFYSVAAVRHSVLTLAIEMAKISKLNWLNVPKLSLRVLDGLAIVL